MKWSVKSSWERSKRFVREVRSELRKVQWPSRRELGLYTVIVAASVLLISSLVWVIDGVLTQALGLIIR